MRNIKIFPFERNQYFFGKLLTVNDFETEQKYFNDKRRLINRMLFGTGVVAGLSTMKVDESTIVVDSGLALDGTGREIVVDKAVIKKLSMIDGFSDSHEEFQPYVYLCIEYDERKIEPVHSISNSVLKDEAYNKFAESYRFYLTTDEPKKEEYGSVSQYYKDINVVYEGNGIRIKHICPKYVESDKEFEMLVEIEKINQSLQIKLEYELDLLWLSSGNNKLMFDESSEPTGKQIFTKTFKLKAANVGNVIASAAIRENTMKLILEGGLEKQLEPTGCNTVNIITGSIKDSFIKDFFDQSLEQIVDYKTQERLYLAKINLVRWGDSYEIGDIIKIPFNQYVTSNEINRILSEIESGAMDDVVPAETPGRTAGMAYHNSHTPNFVNSGVTSIDLGDNPKESQVFYSGDIPHGMGLGEVHIVLGRTNRLKNSDYIFGDTSIFLKEKDDVYATLAAQANPATGMFKIGVRLLSNTDARKIEVTWLAVKDLGSAKTYADEKHISVKPDMTYVNVRETVWFEADVKGLLDKSVVWSVKEKNGGFIDKKGLYTAPNSTGIYEIMAKSVSNPEISGSAFVAVKKN